jgi:hypothetical protein
MQIFPRSLNLLPLVAAVALAVGGGVVTFIVAYYFSFWNVQVGYAPIQPIPFSHRLHAGQLGMDCRYCHANVERSFEAMVPATQTCWGCHSIVRCSPDHAQPCSAAIRPIRESFETGDPIEWVRVHNLPDHAYFDHSVHLSAGVGCSSCHGRIDQMEVVTLQTPLSMSWCLDCHRNPEPHVRPVGVAVTDMTWEPREIEEETEEVQVARYVLPPENCSGCHR